MSAFAQGRPGGAAMNGKISGTIVDKDNGKAIPTTTIAIWRAADSTLVTGAVTLDDGSFGIDGLRPGQYYARVSFVGYESFHVSDIVLKPGQMEAKLGTVKLVSDSQMLDEVEVTAERDFVEIGIDRTVYNTKDQLVSAGGSASDVLGNIPSVEVDIDGNVSLRGNQNVAVLINGRPTPMSGDALTGYLQGLPAEVIERVEVIPNPSAKYEPDGMAGILNIVLAKNREIGLSGGVTLSAATQGNYSASTNIGIQRGPINFFTTYGFRYGDREGEGERYWLDRLSDPEFALDQSSFDNRQSVSHNLNTTLDYNLSEKSTLTLGGTISHRGGERDGLTAYSELAAQQVLSNRFDRESLQDNLDLSTEYRLGYRWTADPGSHELNIEAEYEEEWEEDDGSYMEEAYDLTDMALTSISEQQKDLQDENNREVSFLIDYTRPLGEVSKLEVGMRSELNLLHSDFFSETLNLETGQFEADVNLNNTFDYDQQVHAAYGILGTEVGRFGAQGGVRLEQALTTFNLKTTNEAFENNYFSVFPSAYLTYKLTDTRTLKLAYSKRINRPRTGGRFNQLNPFNSNEDPYNIRVGNPYLKPEYVHAFEFSFTQFTKATSLTLTPYFRHTVDVIRFYQRFEEGVSVLTFENFDTSNSWGAEVIGTFRQGRKFNAYASFNAYKVVTDGSNVDTGLSNNALGFSTRFNGTYNISPSLDMQFSYFYRAPMNIENGRMAAMQSANLALRQKLFNDKANLSLRVSDIFGTMGFSMLRDDTRFFQEMNRSFQAQGIGINFSYNFGKQSKRNRSRGNMEERSAGPDEVSIEM